MFNQLVPYGTDLQNETQSVKAAFLQILLEGRERAVTEDRRMNDTNTSDMQAERKGRAELAVIRSASDVRAKEAALVPVVSQTCTCVCMHTCLRARHTPY